MSKMSLHFVGGHHSEKQTVGKLSPQEEQATLLSCQLAFAGASKYV